ncbi:MAG TPA: 23S rRNA (uracil(1939)-C(5))-methyltransferase RlmD, partial [Oscillospiraceae bacterium]|nr:23S rRNA (uracil(1939)-C(5))-methyltransferase RlmD [Oscillospiraceae bacterium]
MVTREETVRIGGLSSEGAGVARLPDGMAVFVPCALPGERCRVRVEHVGRRAAHAVLLEVLEASPHRIAPDCPHFGVCGGCAFRHMDYEGECEAKRARVEEALRRIGGADVRVEEFLAVEETERYRNKAQYPVGPEGPGFYRAGSHAVVPVSDCRLLPEAVNAAAGAVGKWMARYDVSPYDEKNGTGLLRHVYARHGKAGETLVCLVTAGAGLPHRDALCQMLRAAVPGLIGVVQNVNREKTNVILGPAYRTVWGEDHLTDDLCGKRFRLSVPSFYQVNRRQTERLYAKVLEYAALTGEETVLDLYCGIGTITLCLAGGAKCAVGAEIVPAAVRDAEENARRNGVTNARFLCADAAEAAARL